MIPYFPEHRALTLDERIAQHPEIACAAAGCRIVSATAWDDGLDCVRLYHFADNGGANSSTLIGNEDIENTDVDLVEATGVRYEGPPAAPRSIRNATRGAPTTPAGAQRNEDQDDHEPLPTPHLRNPGGHHPDRARLDGRHPHHLHRV